MHNYWGQSYFKPNWFENYSDEEISLLHVFVKFLLRSVFTNTYFFTLRVIAAAQYISSKRNVPKQNYHIWGRGVDKQKKKKVLCQIMGQLQPPLLSIAVFAYSVWVSELYMYMYCTTWMLLIVTRCRTFVSLKYCIRLYHFVFTCARMIVFAWKGVILRMFPNSVINVCGFEIKGFLCTWNKVHFRD